MANIPLKSIKFPDLADTYTVPSNAGELSYDKSATYPADTVGKALQNKPDEDGTIANAEQLTSNIYEEDNTPYNFRTSGGSIDIGDRETDMLVGGSVVWNQLVIDPSLTDTSKIHARYSTFTASNGIVTAIPDSSGTERGCRFDISNYVIGHKFLIGAWVKTTKTGHINVSLNGASIASVKRPITAGVFTYMCNIFLSESGNQNPSLSLYQSDSLATTDELQYTKPQVYDLTAMFGSTIADYIYSLETANAGAGVAFFRKLFPKPYYAYNAGELMSVQASRHDMVGFNAWDEETELGGIGSSNGVPYSSNSSLRSKNFCGCVGGQTYYFKGTFACYWYDENQGFIKTDYVGNNTKVAPTNARYFKIALYEAYGTTYKNDICINISWDGERDGEYEEYVKHSYALDSDLVLRGIPKLDNGNLYYDGDTYESDGTVTRKYGIVDLGTLTYGYSLSTKLFSTTLSDIIPTTTAESHIINPIYNYASLGGSGNDPDMTIFQYQKTIYITNFAYTNIDSFTSAMSGVYLVYELATPTTEEADAYTNPQIVNDFGTEEYVDYPYSQGTRDVAIPVGHQTQYMANLKAKLEMSPNSPEGAGDYIVRQTNGENEYVTLASNATIQNIIARLEALEGQNAES